jgi:hypothetical protein
MIYFYIATGLVVAFPFGYRIYIRRLEIKGWKMAAEDLWSPREPGKPGDHETRWLFTGPAMNSYQNQHKIKTHHPITFIRSMRTAAVKGSLFAYLKMKAKLKTGEWKVSHNITEQDVYNIATNGPLLMIAKLDGDLLSFTTPEMPANDKTFLDPSNFTLVVDVKNKNVHSASWKGNDLNGDYGKIMSLLIAMLIIWVHPQTHVASELSAREIAKKNLEHLEPSNRFVLALHDGLLFSKHSPLTQNNPLFINVDRQFVIDCAINLKMPHIFDPNKMQFSYYRYLIEARGILIGKLKKYDLDVQPDLLFNNMIVHSIDHYLLYKHLSGCIWSMDGQDTNESYWRSQVFSKVWVRDLETPLQKERIRKLNRKKYPFYGELYDELKPLNKELSDCILASTSF